MIIIKASTVYSNKCCNTLFHLSLLLVFDPVDSNDIGVCLENIIITTGNYLLINIDVCFNKPILWALWALWPFFSIIIITILIIIQSFKQENMVLYITNTNNYYYVYMYM